jgi:hypothetical protein
VKKTFIFFTLIFLSFANIATAQNYYSGFYKNISIENINIESVDFHYTIKPFDYNIEFKYDSSNVKSKFLIDNLFQRNSDNLSLSVNPQFRSIFSNSFNDNSLNYFLSFGTNFNANYKSKLFINAYLVLSEIDVSNENSFYISETKFIPNFGKYFWSQNNKFAFIDFEGKINYIASKYINFEIGKGRNFFGAGYNSLFLSENSNSYPYFKSDISVGKIKYIWLIASIKDYQLLGNQTQDFAGDKMAFIHYLSVNIFKRLNFNFFEAIVSSPYDKNFDRKGYDLSYFNPVIFYRPTEFANGTNDNALLGTSLNIRIFKKTLIYSQFILDDLIISELKAGNGWWGNKFGYQFGFKSFNLFSIKNLFFLAEYNKVTPYTYSHYTQNINYGNFSVPLAHFAGSNFREYLSFIQYKKNRFLFEFKFSRLEKGIDNSDLISFGGDIYKSYELRPSDYGVKFLQGERFLKTEFNPEFNFIINEKSDLHFILSYKFSIEKIGIDESRYSTFYIGFSTNFWKNNINIVK